MQARAAGSGENYFGNAWSNGCVARMAISLGIKAPLDYSVFSASAAALLFGFVPNAYRGEVQSRENVAAEPVVGYL